MKVRRMVLLLASLAAAACSRPEVACDEMAGPPKVMVEGKTLVVITEPVKESPPTFCEPHIRFDGREITIHGTYLYRKHFKTRVDIPQAALDEKGPWRAVWIDPDGSETLLPVNLYSSE